MVTRAIHIEIAHASNTNAFSNAFSRFTARRGKVAKVIKDYGSNLVGGERELREKIQRWSQAQKIFCRKAYNGILIHLALPIIEVFSNEWYNQSKE